MGIAGRITAASIVLAVCVSALAEDWPRWRGPRGDGISQESEWAKPWQGALNRVWSASVGVGYASPVAAGGRVYVLAQKDEQEVLTCLDAASGKVLWAEGYQGGWTRSYPGSRSTPVVEGGRVYTYGGMGELVCRDAATGKQLWRVDVPREMGTQPLQWGIAATPLIDGDQIYVQTGKGGPIAIAVHKQTGKGVWKSQATGLGGYAHPILAQVGDVKHLVVFAGDTVYGMDTATGKTIWSEPWKTRYDVNATTPVYRDGHLFLTSNYGAGCMMLQLSPSGARRLWSSKAMMARFNPPVLDGNALYGNSEGTLVCLSWPDGKVLWQTDGADKPALGMGGSLLRVGDALLLLSEKGRLTLVKATPEGWQKLSEAEVVKGGQVWAAPLLYDGRLYVKGESELVCYTRD